MKILIIGGSGFIGTRLSLLLSKKKVNFEIIDKVTSTKFPELTRKVDVRSFSELVDSIDDSSVLINLAAEHQDNVIPSSLYYDVNVSGALNVCKVAREKSVSKIIFTSSVAVYGFAPAGTDEHGLIAPFNDYGRSKIEAELIYREWQLEDPLVRTLVIIRPTVVFGEGNRGNVYNLLKQIYSGKFIMIGSGLNRKSMAYVENIASFLEYSLGFNPGVHLYNYADKPDFTMISLVQHVNKLLGKPSSIGCRLPYYLGLLIGFVFDVISSLRGKNFLISSIRVKKFCSDSIYNSAVESTGFVPPVPLIEAIERTVGCEFLAAEKIKSLEHR